MLAGKFRTLWIIFISAITTIRCSVTALVLSAIGKLSRERADKIMRSFGKHMLRHVKLSYKVVNPHQINFSENKRYIIMLNHSSLYDIPLTFVAIPKSIRMISKKELLRIPLFGKAMKSAEHIFIDRKDREQAIKDLHLAKQKMESGLIVWVAPEGTRSKTGELGEFKKGGFITAIQAGATIVPIS